MSHQREARRSVRAVSSRFSILPLVSTQGIFRCCFSAHCYGVEKVFDSSMVFGVEVDGDAGARRDRVEVDGDDDSSPDDAFLNTSHESLSDRRVL